MRPVEAELRHQPDSDEHARGRVFREVNECIRALTTTAASTTRREFICECADLACLDVVPLTLAQYDAIRAADRAVLALRHGDGDGVRGMASRSRLLRQA